MEDTGVFPKAAEPFAVCKLVLLDGWEVPGWDSFRVEENDVELQLDLGGLTPRGTLKNTNLLVENKKNIYNSYKMGKLILQGTFRFQFVHEF